MLLFFIRSSGVLLLLSAAAKIVSAAGSAPILGVPDPVLAIPFRHEFFLVGLIETFIGAYCLVGSRPFVQLGLIGWLATSFAVYRLGLLWLGVHICKCFGTLSDAFHMSTTTANVISLVLFAYLLLGSYTGVLRAWATRPQS
jgi:hypothetical protein